MMDALRVTKVLERMAYRCLNILMSFIPIKRNRVFFMSFYGKSYSDNPKAISVALYEKYGNQFEHVWVLNNPTDDVPKYIRLCKYNTLKMLYYISTSKVWVSNSSFRKSTYKRNAQFYIQTWHGDRGFKKILLGIANNDHYMFETDHADLMTAGSEFGLKHYYRKGFNYKKEIIMEGSPRNDIFFKDTSVLQSKIRKRYGILPKDKVVMFAPTFRGKYRNRQQEVSLDLEKVRQTLELVTFKHWVVLVRSHIANAQKGMTISFNENIKSVTDYPDMNELLQITDILISDYSSSIGDFALSGKFCILYQDDIDEYECNDRELVFEMDNSPFFHFKTQDELLKFLSSISVYDSVNNTNEINVFYGVHESGRASEIVAERIAGECKNAL